MGFFTQHVSEQVITYKCKKRKQRKPECIWFSDDKWISVIGLMIGFAMSGYFFPVIQSVLLCILCVIAAVGTMVDSQIRIIPNELVLLVLAIGVLFNFAEGGGKRFLWSVLSGLITFAVFFLASIITYYFVKKIGVGGGDVKLATVAAFTCGLDRLTGFYVGIVLALLVYIAYGLYFKKFRIGGAFPMGGQIMGGFLAAFFIPYLLPLISG